MNRRLMSGGIFSKRPKFVRVVVMRRTPRPGDRLASETLPRVTSLTPPTMTAEQLAELAAATSREKVPTMPAAGDVTVQLAKKKKPPPKRMFSKIARSRGACGGAVDRVTWKIKTRGAWVIREWRGSPKGAWAFGKTLLFPSAAKAREFAERKVRQKKNQKDGYVEA